MSQDKEVESVSVVLSAPQLAAVLANQTLSPTDMQSNRLWGGLAIAGGVLEMAGAGVLCALPEPLSKADALRLACMAQIWRPPGSSRCGRAKIQRR